MFLGIGFHHAALRELIILMVLNLCHSGRWFVHTCRCTCVCMCANVHNVLKDVITQPSSEILFLVFISRTSSVRPGLKRRIQWCWKHGVSLLEPGGATVYGAVRCGGALEGQPGFLIQPSAGVMLCSAGCPGHSRHPHKACNYIWGRKAQREEGFKWFVCRAGGGSRFIRSLSCMSLQIYFSNSSFHELV